MADPNHCPKTSDNKHVPGGISPRENKGFKFEDTNCKECNLPGRRQKGGRAWTWGHEITSMPGGF